MLKILSGILLILLIVLMNCQTHIPVEPFQMVPTIVNVQFNGYEITDRYLSKSGSHQASAFEKIKIEVYDIGQVTDNITQNQPIAVTEISIAAGATTFEGKIEVPAGKNRLFIGKLYEKTVQDTLAFISYAGRQGGVAIEIDRLNEVTLPLYPVPIRGKRVVLWTWPVTIKANNIPPVMVGITTQDTLRGIQFDVDFNPPVLQIQAIDTTALSSRISEIYFSNFQDVGTRIVAFSQSAQRDILFPVGDISAEPLAFMKMNLMIRPGQPLNIEKIGLIFKNARISALNYVPLDVFFVPAMLTIATN